MVNVMTFVSDKVIFFLGGDVPSSIVVEFTFLNLFGLLDTCDSFNDSNIILTAKLFRQGYR